MILFNSQEGVDYPSGSYFYQWGNWGPEKRSLCNSWTRERGLGSRFFWYWSFSYCGHALLFSVLFPLHSASQNHWLESWHLRGRGDHRGHLSGPSLLALKIWKPDISNHRPFGEWAPPICHWALTWNGRTRTGSPPKWRGAQKLAPDHFWQVHTALCASTGWRKLHLSNLSA